MLLALLASGCQVVFGLGDYEATGGAEPSSGGTPTGAGASEGGRAGTGAGGEGANGAGGSGGATPSPWVAVELIEVGLGVPPALCLSGEPRINLFGGESGLSCTPCSADPEMGSCLSELTCFSNLGCSNGATVVSSSDQCVDIGLHQGCRASEPTGASCTPVAGGQLVGVNALQSFASLCPCESCGTCVAAEGDFGAAACAELERPNHYALRQDPTVSGSCSPCAMDPVCSTGAAYRIGDGIGDCDTDVQAGECKVLALGALKAQRAVATNCQATGGVLAIEGRSPVWTLCCSEPLPPEFETPLP